MTSNVPMKNHDIMTSAEPGGPQMQKTLLSDSDRLQDCYSHKRIPLPAMLLTNLDVIPVPREWPWTMTFGLPSAHLLTNHSKAV